MSSLISSVCWVQRGVAARTPKKYTLDEGELARVSKLAMLRLDDARMQLAIAQEPDAEEGEWEDASDDDSDDDEGGDDDVEMSDAQGPATTGEQGGNQDLSKYNLDSYDKEESKGAAMGPFSNIKGLSYYANNDEDPYITLKDKDEDAEGEREELEVYPTDNMLVAAKTQDDVSQLEIYVYDESQENLYVHHDILLPALPLCLEWMDFGPRSSSAEDPNPDTNRKGNYVAIGTLDPEVEIWSLDVVDSLYPDAILGPPRTGSSTKLSELTTAKPKKKKKQQAAEVNPSFHSDAVLGLSWNRSHRNLLASSSADTTIKLWDMNLPSGSPAIRSFNLHSDKVQAIQWGIKDPTVLLSGSYDKQVAIFDTRAPAGKLGLTLTADAECLKWDPWDPNSFFVSLENGTVQKYDTRTLAASSDSALATWTLSAHDSAVSSFDVNPHIPGCIVTGGVDKFVKVWNVNEGASARNISLVTSRDLGVGKVFSLSFSPDDPMTLAVAGSKAKLQIWDAASNAGVRSAFASRLQQAGKELTSKRAEVVGIEDEGEDEEEED